MNDAGRWFLLALAAVPIVPSCKDEQSPLQERCRDAVAKNLQCYGSYTPAQTHTYAKSYCEYILDYTAEYGEDCPEAAVEIQACLSSLDCAPTPEELGACTEAQRTAHELCPELFGVCAVNLVGTGEGVCSFGGEQCFDGKTYDVTCTVAATDRLDCTCSIDGAIVGSYSVAGTCNDFAFTEPAQAECGFPPGTP